MKNIKFAFKNSSKNDFIMNLIIVICSLLLVFVGAKFFTSGEQASSSKYSIIVFAIAIAVAYCKIAVEAIEKLIAKRFDYNLLSIFSVLVIFASQHFKEAAIVAVIYSFCKCIYDLICADFSEKVISNCDEKLFYTVISDGKEVKKAYSDLQEGDKVLAHNGEFLAFSYVFDGNKKVFKSGNFHYNNEVEVTVVQLADYEIDFSVVNKNTMSKTEKILQIITYAYMLSILSFALYLFVKSIVKGDGAYAGLYKFGLFSLFLNPFTINSGLIFANLFSILSLKKEGVCIKDNADLEKLSNTKTVVFEPSTVCEADETLNNEVVKAVKIAKLLKIDTAYLGDENSNEFSLAGFQKCLDKVPDENGITYVCEKNSEFNNALVVSTDSKEENCVEKASLTKLVKAFVKTKWVKVFQIVRVALGVVINFAVMATFLSSSIVNKISNYVIENGNTETKSIIVKILEQTNDGSTLSPWIIAVVQLAVIIIFMFVSLSFYNKNCNKKLRWGEVFLYSIWPLFS